MSTIREDIEQFPTLTFWYGLSYSELMEMPNWALRLYAGALPGLLAEYQATHITAASFPYMEKKGQRDVQRRLRRSIRGQQETPSPKIGREAYRARMMAMGFGWQDVPAKKKTEGSE